MSKTDDLRATFFQESEELLEGLADGLIELDSGSADGETINSIFRAVHSIKGGAAAFGLDEVVRFAHRFENVLDAMRTSSLEGTSSVLEILTRAADHLTSLIEAVRDDTEPNAAISDTLIAELATLTDTDESESAPPQIDFQPTTVSLGEIDQPGNEDRTFHIRFVPTAELYTSGNEPLFLLRDLNTLGDAQIHCDLSALPKFDAIDPAASYLAWDIELITDANEPAIREVFEFVDGLCDLTIEEKSGALPQLPELQSLPDLPELPPLAKTETASQNADPPQNRPAPAPARSATPIQPVASTIRVELHRIDRMINLVGELVINQAMLSQCVKRAGIPKSGDIDVGLEELLNLTRQIQDSVMAIRAQPVKPLFQRMSRIAREVGSEVSKTLRVITHGAGTEIDKTVVEKLGDPLTHMIRNAVDHGLESSEARIAAGKDPIGTIQLSAAHQSGRVVIEISDDGAGINRERVRAIAEEKGLISPDAQLTPGEIDNLIFMPGFSTATELSNLSGRGVGMDVVRQAIQLLGGRVSISSTEGQGSTFSIVLPLTLAVLDGMVIGVGGQTVVVPLSAIVETMRLDPKQVFQLGTESSVVRIRGSYVPIVDVGAILGYRPPVQSAETSVFMLVETADGARAALLIDDIYDQRQVVIKGLEENYGNVDGVAAATILGDGRIALILDPTAIVGDAGVEMSDTPPLAAAE